MLQPYVQVLICLTMQASVMSLCQEQVDQETFLTMQQEFLRLKKEGNQNAQKMRE